MRQGWLEPFPAAARVVELTAAPPDHGMHRVDRRLLGPVGPLLDADLRGPAAPRASGPKASRALRVAELAARFAGPAGWGPHAVFRELAATLPADATVTVDSGAHRILFSQMWRARRPLEVLQSAGFCTMGAALPLAIGVQRPSPGARSWPCSAMAGWRWAWASSARCATRACAVILVVLQDESLALIELKQRQAGLPQLGVRLGRTDLPAVARAFGGAGARGRIG